MKVTIEKIDKNQIKIGVNVDNDIFQNAILKSYRKNASNFNVQGFRKGKVPLNYIKKVYGESVFYEDAANFCIDDTYPEALKENSIRPVDYPKIEIIEMGEGKNFEYSAVVTVQPEVEIEKYKNLGIDKIRYVVADQDVDRELKDMQEKNATIESRDEGSKLQYKDIAIIDFKGYIDGVPFEGGEGNDFSLEIGSKTFIGDFEEQLIGLKVGDKKDVFVTFPKDYGRPQLNGKDAKFEVNVKDVKFKILPELDDEFAKDVSEFDTLEELKLDIRKRQEEINKQREKRETEDKLLDEVVNNTKIDLPEVMVKREVDVMMNDFEARLKQQGLDLNSYLNYVGITEEEMRNNMRETAEKRIKVILTIDKISEIEKMDASENEINEKANEIAKAYSPKEYEKLADTLMKTQRDNLINDVKRSKVVDLLMRENED